MPLPSVTHYDSFLTGLGVAAFQQPPFGYVMKNIFPTIRVNRQSDKYRIWDDEDFLRDDFEVLPISTESAGTDFKFSSDTYYATRYALHVDIDDQELNNADSDIDLVSSSIQVLASKGQLKLERQGIAKLMTTSVWGQDLTGVSGAPGANQFKQWNDAASTPITDFDTASDIVLNKTGLVPNVAVVSQAVWRALQRHASVAARFQYVRDYSQVSEDMVAAVLGLERLYVVRSIRTTNVEGATKAYSTNLGKVAWLGYVPANVGPMTPTPAAYFAWDGVGGMPGISETTPIFRFRMDEIHSDRIEAYLAFDVKVTAPSLGVFFNTAVA